MKTIRAEEFIANLGLRSARATAQAYLAEARLTRHWGGEDWFNGWARETGLVQPCDWCEHTKRWPGFSIWLEI